MVLCSCTPCELYDMTNVLLTVTTTTAHICEQLPEGLHHDIGQGFEGVADVRVLGAAQPLRCRSQPRLHRLEAVHARYGRVCHIEARSASGCTKRC